MKSTTSEIYQDTKRLIGFATSIDPEDIYASAGHPLPSRLPGAITHSVVKQAEKHRNINTSDETVNFLQFAIRDTQNALDPWIRHQTSHESALALINHPETTRALAILALRDEDTLTSLLRVLERDMTRRSSYTYVPHVVLPPDIAPSIYHGCPAAAHASERDINPLFDRTVKWAGRLALESISHHGISPALTRPKN